MIIFGLGNPGLRYRATRHNAGYLFLDRFAKHRNIKYHTARGFRIATTRIASRKIQLVKPQCFMNDSGLAISRFVEDSQHTILVVVDDINLPLGRIRLREKGSDGGHLGLRSIIDELKSSDFPRLRIGIGLSDKSVTYHVLSRFTRPEKKILWQVIDNGIIGIEILFRKGFLKAQDHINSIDLT